MVNGILVMSLMVALISPPPAQKLPTSAGSFAKQCEEPSPKDLATSVSLGVAYGHCLGVFDGWIGANRLMFQLKGRPLFCPPEGVTADQGRRIFLKYIAEHPELVQEGPSETGIVSLTMAFPCSDR
jgi:hypothetical protein